MKKISYILSAVALVSIMAVSCNQKPKDMLIKKWQFKSMDEKEVEAMMSKSMEASKQMIDTISNPEEKAMKEKEMKESMEKSKTAMMEMMKSMKMEFKADGTYEASKPMGGGNETGKWELSEDGKKLTMTDDKNKDKKDEMEVTVSKESLIMAMKDGEMSMHMTFEPGK